MHFSNILISVNQAHQNLRHQSPRAVTQLVMMEAKLKHKHVPMYKMLNLCLVIYLWELFNYSTNLNYVQYIVEIR